MKMMQRPHPSFDFAVQLEALGDAYRITFLQVESVACQWDVHVGSYFAHVGEDALHPLDILSIDRDGSPEEHQERVQPGWAFFRLTNNHDLVVEQAAYLDRYVAVGGVQAALIRQL